MNGYADIFLYQLFCTRSYQKEICAYPINEKRENKKLPFTEEEVLQVNYFLPFSLAAILYFISRRRFILL